mmetsp:Transcript_54410/g.172884  ORF Transcript_54410/g.172884 Transcript_54410/m.172884 type:complete len:175 (+) Transcript_54410:140-664(+)
MSSSPLPLPAAITRTNRARGMLYVGGVSLAKGAWDCDAKKPIPPEDEARVFEEVPSMEHSFEGIPTIGPKKDLRHMAWYCNGTRYRMEAYPDWLVSKCKEGLFKGGIRRSNKPSSNTRGISSWTDIALIYAGQEMENDKPLDHYNVPPGCCVMIAMEKEKLNLKKPDPDSAYWN